MMLEFVPLLSLKISTTHGKLALFSNTEYTMHFLAYMKLVLHETSLFWEHFMTDFCWFIDLLIYMYFKLNRCLKGVPYRLLVRRPVFYFLKS